MNQLNNTLSVRSILILIIYLLATAPGAAEENSGINQFIESNVLGIFYHELGHAVIDIEMLPVLGQEEDAADVFSIFMIDALFDDQSAESLAYDASFGFWAEAEDRQSYSEDIPWWDVHGPDEQRYFNTVCIFYGADPNNRQQFAEDLGLPEERAETCDIEYDQANASWGRVLGRLINRGPGQSLSFESQDDSLISRTLELEIKQLNGEMQLSHDVEVSVESCDEANAYYDHEDRRIVFCTEFEAHLKNLARLLQE